ncbi:hypothetical protein [Paenibacillus antarcticus]|uniref:Uncharacterized protein n=1 Tax=Paenibacillus antarcticus TaxID=253703 RepID=A0A162Q773_9BACL|nr:hypothetical protein [Paenibacillus antarcticus]OAB43040.1 hypothetical protein PBAT_18750 [Paenibacillus antarcticus]
MKYSLNRLYLHTIDLINKKEIDEINQNIDLFGDILRTIVQESKNPTKSQFMKVWLQYVDQIGEKLIENGLAKLAVGMSRSLYAVIEREHRVPLVFGNMIKNLLKQIPEQKSSESVKELNLLFLLDDMFNNTGIYDGQYYNHDVVIEFSRYYYFISKNKFLNDLEKSSLISELFQHCMYLMYYKRTEEDLEKIQIVSNIILYLLKTMIDEKDVANFNQSIDILKESDFLIRDSINLVSMHLKIAVYLYYLGIKEPLTSEGRHQYKRMMLSGSDYWRDLLFGTSLWGNYSEVQNALSSWERLEGSNAKWLMMKSVVREFFLFYDLVSGNLNIDRIPEDILNESEVFSFISSHFNGSKINVETIQEYHQFKKMIGLDGDEESARIEIMLLSEQILMRYKEIKFKEVKIASKAVDVINHNIKIIEEESKTITYNNPYFISAGNGFDVAEELETYMFNYNFSTHIQFIATKKEAKIEFYLRTYKRKLEDFILDVFEQKGFIKESLTYEERHKISKLFRLVDSITNDESVNINSFIYGISSNTSILYREDESEKIRLQKFIEGMNAFETDYFVWVGFDSKLTRLLVRDIEVKINDLSDIEIKKEMEKNKLSDGQFNLNIVNDVSVLFNEDEATEYLKLSRKIVSISLRFDAKIIDIPGFIIKVTK